MQPLIEYEAARKDFGDKRVLDRIDLAVAHREIVVLLGASGGGKTLILRMLVGLLRPDEGDVRFGGVSIPRLHERELRPVRRRIGYVFQESALFDSLSVADNVAYALHVSDPASRAQAATRTAECLALVGLKEAGALAVAELSGGMRKRVAIARALATRPEALVYDEPTAGLDPANVRRVAQIIRQLHQELESTALVVTHDSKLAFEIADRLCLLSHGRIAWSGPAAEAREHPPELLARFFAGQELARA